MNSVLRSLSGLRSGSCSLLKLGMKATVVAGLLGGFVLAATPSVHAQTLLSEGFDETSTLDDWFVDNNSDDAAAGYSGWFLPDAATVSDTFPAQAGASTSYAFSDFGASASSGTLSTWLITPTLTYQNGDVFSFWTRTIENPATFPDRLDVRFSANGTSTNVGTTPTAVGDFTKLLTSINPTLTPTGYPAVWTKISLTLSGLSGPTTGRVAFNYFVTDGGPNGANSNYVGVDTVSVVRPAADIAPEPGSLALLAIGALPLVGMARRRKRA